MGFNITRCYIVAIMKTIILFILLTITVLSQTKLSINPGIKLGIAFGEKTQFIFGTEVSFVFYDFRKDWYPRVGIVIDYDGIDNLERLHFGIEYMYRAVGIDVGPTFAWKDSELHYGFSIIPFGGALIVPYLNYTNIKGIKDQFDFGTYLKIPIPLSHERISFGG